jgi:hypothetical protein
VQSVFVMGVIKQTHKILWSVVGEVKEMRKKVSAIVSYDLT